MQKIAKLLFLLLLLFPTFLYGQASTYVPLTDSVYQSIAKLEAVGWVKTAYWNQRPWTKTEVKRLLNEAEKNVDPQSSHLQKILENELQRFSDDRNWFVKPLQSVSLEHSYVSRGPTPIQDNGLEKIRGDFQPLTAYREGKNYPEGNSLNISTIHEAQLSSFAALHANPVGDTTAHFYPHHLYANFGYKNILLSLGRNHMLWGPMKNGGGFLSSNARGLDRLELTTPHPFRLPWILQKIGSWRSTIFFAHLGPERDNPNPILSGWRLDWKPIHWADVGLHHAVVMGGDRSIDPTPTESVQEFIGLTKPGRSRATTNHLFGADLTFQIPKWRGTKFYLEANFDDTDNDLHLLFLDNAAWAGGIFLPMLDQAGKWSLRNELERVGPRPYHHSSYTSGWTLNRKLLGNPVGPDSWLGTTELNYQYSMRTSMTGTARYINRSGDIYRIISSAPGEIDGIQKIQNLPNEQHWILSLQGNHEFRKNWVFGLQLNLDPTINKDFQEGKNKTDFSSFLTISWNLPE